MIIQELQITQLRAIENGVFAFASDMNLLVGVNGVGKSTVLDALRTLLSNVIPALTDDRSQPLDFVARDVTMGHAFLSLQVTCQLADTPFVFLVHKPLEEYIADPEREGEVRHQTTPTPERKEWLSTQPGIPIDTRTLKQIVRQSRDVPLAIYFAPQRSVISRKAPRRAGAHADALRPRPLRLREFAEWWRARDALAEEDPKYRRQRDALNEAVSVFLDDCRNLRATDEKEPTLLLDKDGMELDVDQLSDGERGVLAIVLDLTRRLALAYPKLDDPAREGQAIVLIDELDLHLHPKWQRQIVHRLTRTFPRCQFICTTHSPQVISELETGNLIFLVRDEGKIKVEPSTRGYGLDTNWILEHLMGVRSRPEPAQALIEQIEQAMDEADFEQARAQLEEMRQMIHGYDDEVARLEASIETLEVL